MWRRIGLVGRACLEKAGLAFLALCASVGGGIALTAMLAYAMLALEGAAQWEAIANLAYGLLILLGLVMLSLHRLLGSKLSLDLEFWKLKAGFKQGDEG